MLKILKVLLLTIGVILMVNISSKVSAQEIELLGYAWSENIGWISFNCANKGVCGVSDYKVTIDPTTGNLKGYAWAGGGEDASGNSVPTIGWIDFDPAGPYPGPPNYSVKAVNLSQAGISNVKVEGWAKVLATDGSWDGWIKFGYPSPSGSYFDANGDFHGYAYGDLVVGWISLNCDNTGACGSSDYKVWVNFPPPSCSISFNPAKISLGDSTTLSWSSFLATQANLTTQGSASVFGSGVVALSDSLTMTPTLLGEGKAILNLSGPGGVGSCQADLEVGGLEVTSTVAGWIWQTQKIDLNWNSDSVNECRRWIEVWNPFTSTKLKDTLAGEEIPYDVWSSDINNDGIIDWTNEVSGTISEIYPGSGPPDASGKQPRHWIGKLWKYVIECRNTNYPGAGTLKKEFSIEVKPRPIWREIAPW